MTVRLMIAAMVGCVLCTSFAAAQVVRYRRPVVVRDYGSPPIRVLPAPPTPDLYGRTTFYYRSPYAAAPVIRRVSADIPKPRLPRSVVIPGAEIRAETRAPVIRENEIRGDVRLRSFADDACTPAADPYAYSPVPSPAVPQASPAPRGYRPVLPLSSVPQNYYVGRGIIGQPKLYVPGQPIRNFFRYLTY